MDKKAIKRILFHIQRFRSQLIYGSFISTIYILLMSTLYPGEDGVKTYSDAMTETAIGGLLANMNTSNPGWTFWIAMQTSFLLYMVLAICAILMGRKLVPSQERDALEIFLGVNPQSARRFYAENMIAAIFNLFLISIPSFLILVVASIVNDATDIIGRLAITYLLVITVVTFFLVISSLLAVLDFSSTTGMKMGMGYLIFAVFIEMNFADSTSNQDYANLSVNYYANTAAGLISGSFDWNSIFVIIFIIITGISLTYWRVKYPDYLETEIKVPVTVEVSDIAIVADQSKLSHRYPLLFDQLRNDFKPLVLVISLISFILFAVIGSYIPETIDEVLREADTPSARAMIQNHDLQYNYTGFIVIKFFGMNWAYMGIFVALISANVATRDVRFDSQDILWSNNIKAKNLIFYRTTAVLLEITVFVWGLFIVETLLETSMDAEINRLHLFQAYSVIWIHLLGLSIFLIALSMVPKVSEGRKWSLLTFIGFVLINIIAFTSSKVEFLKYFSYISYLDNVGLIYGINNYFLDLLISLTLGILSTGFFYWALIERYQNKDLL